MKGFTLIELLVVVIIIGILSAIALPQYELVVEKSRAAEAMVNAKAILDACQRHLQEFPDDTCDNKSKIADVQLKGGTWDRTDGTATCFKTKNFTYDIVAAEGTLYVGRNESAGDCTNGSNDIYSIQYDMTSGQVLTDPSSCNDYEQVCKLFTNI